MRFFILFFSLAVAVHLCWCAPSFARLSGELEWSYGQYHSEEGNSQVTDSSHFAQRYALMFSREGKIMGGRGGGYQLMFGGEWWGLNNSLDVNGVNYDDNIQNGKFIYSGDLTFAPAGLPLYVRLYARDTSRGNFVEDGFALSQGTFDEVFLSRRKNILTPQIITDVVDGVHHEYGASMVLGIKNGSYLGRYRDILSHMPKLYFDYREVYVKDSASRTPEEYRDRDLAFVSLNKKHNWFHYRFYQHESILYPANNYSESTFLLGTIDQNLRREWVNLTNWIQISTDGRYTEWDNRSLSQLSERDYVLNFFAKTERRNWRSSLFSNFARYEVNDRLERYLNVPFTASGDIDRNNAWRFRLDGHRELINRPFEIVNTEQAEDRVYSSIRWETGRISKSISSPKLELEGKFGYLGKGGAARATYELYSNPALAQSSLYDYFSSLSIAYFEGTLSQNISSTSLNYDLLEVTGRFDLAKRLGNRVRTGFGSLVLLGTGKADHVETESIQPLSLSSFKGSNNLNDTDVVIDGSVWRMEAFWFLDHVSRTRINTRFEAGGEYQDFQSDSLGQLYLLHRSDYASAAHRVHVKNEILYGDSLFRGLSSNVFSASIAQSEFDGESFSNETSYSYQPNREHRLSCMARFDLRIVDQGDNGGRIALTQDYRYTRYLYRGVVRRLAEFSQFLDYERFDSGTKTYEAVAVTGLANYYPVSWARIGCKVKWQNDLKLETSDIGYGLYSELTFSRLIVGLEYEYGMRTADNSGAILDRDEQRWSVSVRKVF